MCERRRGKDRPQREVGREDKKREGKNKKQRKERGGCERVNGELK